MKLSTRNQFAGTVVEVEKGEAMAVVKLAIDGTEQVITAAITKDGAEALGLEPGVKAYALVKATEVQIGIDD